MVNTNGSMNKERTFYNEIKLPADSRYEQSTMNYFPLFSATWLIDAKIFI